MPSGRRRLLLPIALAACVGGTPAHAARFSFHGVEFAPADERLPAAEQFLRDKAAAGTPMPVAEQAMRRANAPCGKSVKADGSIACRFSMAVGHALSDMPLGDVVWTVSLYPAADGTVSRATVVRESFGD